MKDIEADGGDMTTIAGGVVACINRKKQEKSEMEKGWAITDWPWFFVLPRNSSHRSPGHETYPDGDWCSEGNLSYRDSPKLLAMMINPSFGICGAIHVLEKISLAFEAEQGWVGWIEANKVRQKMSNHLKHRTIINQPACYIPRFCKPHAIPRVNASQCWTGILFTSHRYTSMTQAPCPFFSKMHQNIWLSK